MCGLGGMLGTNIIDSDIRIARNLLMLNVLRGEDSTGMFDIVPKQKKPVLWWKSEHHPLDFLKGTFNSNWLTRWDKTKPMCIALHTRAATQGKVIKANAHPFYHGNIVGMHNGTISKDFTNRKKFDTDSEALYYNISKLGLADALEDIRDADPAYALVFLDMEKRTVNFIRNNKRPLHYCWYLGSLFWSSDSKHLEVAIADNGYKNPPTIFQFEPYVHYSINLEDKTPTFTKTPIEKAKEPVKTYYSNNSFYTIPEIESWGKEDQSSCTNYYDSVSKKWYSHFQFNKLKELRENTEKEKVVALPPPKEDKEEVPFVASSSKATGTTTKTYRVGPGFHSYCTESVFRSKLRTGCQICGTKGAIHDEVYWTAGNEFLCLDCTEDLVWNKEHWARNHAYYSEDSLKQLEADYWAEHPELLKSFGYN